MRKTVRSDSRGSGSGTGVGRTWRRIHCRRGARPAVRRAGGPAGCAADHDDGLFTAMACGALKRAAPRAVPPNPPPAGPARRGPPRPRAAQPDHDPDHGRSTPLHDRSMSMSAKVAQLRHQRCKDAAVWCGWSGWDQGAPDSGLVGGSVGVAATSGPGPRARRPGEWSPGVPAAAGAGRVPSAARRARGAGGRSVSPARGRAARIGPVPNGRRCAFISRFFPRQPGRGRHIEPRRHRPGTAPGVSRARANRQAAHSAPSRDL